MTRIAGDWLTRPATQAVFSALTRAGYQALAVGGCVRDALLHAPVHDIDIATNALPEDVIRIAEAAGLRPVPTGVDHGTITVISDGVPHEVTTFRRDIETDGRHARVIFADNVAEDAARRDFTMNALYCSAAGEVTDPLGGLADLERRYVRFIGDANARITEDYLRSLRYFRFHAWYGATSDGMDPDALSAIARNLEGLDRLSRERVGSEILKLLTAPDPAPAVAAMRQTGVLARILPGADDRALAPLVHLEDRVAVTPDPIRRLAALGGEATADRLRLSRAQARQYTLLRELFAATMGAAELGHRFGAKTAADTLLLRSALLEMPLPEDMLRQIARGVDARFPVDAADLMPALHGRALGARLDELRARWIASDFSLDRDALLALPDKQG